VQIPAPRLAAERRVECGLVARLAGVVPGHRLCPYRVGGGLPAGPAGQLDLAEPVLGAVGCRDLPVLAVVVAGRPVVQVLDPGSVLAAWAPVVRARDVEQLGGPSAQ